MRPARRRSHCLAVLLAICATLCAGCSEEPGESQGDCSARILLDGTVYRGHNELNQAAPTGTAIGTGEVIGCGSPDEAEVVDTVKVLSVVGVDHSISVATTDSDWVGVYIAEGTPRSAWPETLEN